MRRESLLRLHEAPSECGQAVHAAPKVLGRYEASARRAYHRALKDLRALQAERIQNYRTNPTGTQSNSKSS